MKDDVDFKKLWSGQETAAVPHWQKIVSEAKQLKKKTVGKIILTGLLLAGTAVFVLLIGYYAHPKMITTKIGIMLTILAMLLYIVASGSLLPTLFKNNPEANTNEYLKQLIWIKRRKEFIHRTVFTLYFVFLSTGLFLYMIEYSNMMSMVGGIAAYAITAAWIVFNWFYIRKRRITKEQTEINQMISKLESLSKGMAEE